MMSLTRSLRYLSKSNFSINYHHIANLSPELSDLQHSVRKFVDEKITPIAAKTDLEDNFPNHLWKEFGDMGLLGVTTEE